mgnify:CR=1 FL=1
MIGHQRMQGKEEKKMPNIKLPYNAEGMELADKIADKVENVGGEMSQDVPTNNASMRNTTMDLNDYEAGGNSNIDSMGYYKEGGKVPEYHGGGRVGHKHTKTGDVAYDSDYAPSGKHVKHTKRDSWHKGQRDAEEKIHEEAAIKGTIVGQEIAEALEGKGDVRSVMKSNKAAQKSLGSYAPQRKTYKKAVEKAAKK